MSTITVTTRRPSRRRERRVPRVWLYGLCALSLLAGLTCVSIGLWVQATPDDRSPHPYTPGEPFTAGEHVMFSGDLVLYGSPGPGERPDLADLGCDVTPGGGPLSTTKAHLEDRIVVADVGLVPLVSYPGRVGDSIVCSGPATATAAPLYMVPGMNSRGMVPMAGYTAAALLLTLGGFGVLVLRASRD